MIATPFRFPRYDHSFPAAYKKALRLFEPIFKSSLAPAVSATNPAYNGTARDFLSYFQGSYRRYEYLIPWIRPGVRWLDVGGFWGVLPVALALCGVNVTVAEKMDLYPAAMRAFWKDLEKEFGIQLLDAEFAASVSFPLHDSFDVVSLLSVIEHLPHTPRHLLDNIRGVLAPTGTFLLDVPNIHYFPTILRFLKGRNLHPPIETLYNSTVPYAGHFREYNLHDLEYVLRRAGFGIQTVRFLNYSDRVRLKYFLRPWGWPIILAQLKPFREIIFVASQKNGPALPVL